MWKIPDFGATAAIKQQRLFCRILGGAALVAAGGVRARHYDANDGGGGESAEEDELRDSEAVEKAKRNGRAAG